MATIVASRLEERRKARGLSQRALAERAGTTRQAVGAIESGRMQPGVAIAIGLARALETSVEELFGASGERESKPPARSVGATIAGRAVEHELVRDTLVCEPSAARATCVFVAGCDVAVGLLARHAALRSTDHLVYWLPMTNKAAFRALERGDVHAAVLHEGLGRRGAAPPTHSHQRFDVAATEEGWMFAAGNPLRLRGAANLVSSRATLVNRPHGARARELLDARLRAARLDAHAIAGYERVVPGQLDAARAVAHGFADAAVGTASAARAFGLAFVALEEERCALYLARAMKRTSEGRLLIETLRSAAFRHDLDALQTYDTTSIGETIP